MDAGTKSAEQQASAIAWTADALLCDLQQGTWLFPRMVPTLRLTLTDTLRQRGVKIEAHLPLFVRTSMLYRNQSLSPSAVSRFRAETTAAHQRLAMLAIDDERAYWNAAFHAIAPGTLPAEALPADTESLTEAIGILDRHAPAGDSPLSRWIEGLATFADGPFRSASHPHYFGCIFLRLKRPAHETALSLAHELAHQELFLLNLVDRLITAEADYRLVHAPFQGRQRPPIGRLHSAHALFRMVAHEHATGDPRLEKHLQTLHATIETFVAEDLTVFGRHLVYDVYQSQVDRLRTTRCCG